MKKRLIIAFILVSLIVNLLSCGVFAAAPEPTLIYEEKDVAGTASPLKNSQSYPSYYNSREQGYISTKAEDQGSAGICWTFAQNEVIEAYVAKTTGNIVDLSEQTMKFETSYEHNTKYGHYRGANDGGTEFISMAYLARGGATLEADEPFSESEIRTVIPKRLNYRGVLKSQPILTFDDESQDLAISHIKKLVYENGAVGTGVYYIESTSYQDSKKTCYYYNGPYANPNHSVTIIGWDDNYSRDNFVQKPAGDGAFIVKNTWGRYHNSGTSDLVYISYYDKFIWKNVFSSTFDIQNDIYDNIYQYDHQGYTGAGMFGSDSDIMYATKYKKSSPGESVCAASTFLVSPDTRVEVYVNAQDGSVDQKYKFTKVYEKTFEYSGYYLMEFDPVEITGNEFCVAIRIITSGAAYFPLRANNHGMFVRNATNKEDTCFVSYEGFANMSSIESFGSTFTVNKSMLAMKAFTKNTDFELKDSAQLFIDVKETDWYKSFVDFAVTYNIFSGTSKVTFAPQQTLTRAQFVQVLANISGIDTSEYDIKKTFLDVESTDWFAGAVKWAYDEGIVSGTGYRIFEPEKKITRQEMCVMLVNYCEKYLGMTLIKSNVVFSDHSAIANWASNAVYKCKYANIISGVGDNRFAPNDSATRGQGAAVFTNFYRNFILT